LREEAGSRVLRAAKLKIRKTETVYPPPFTIWNFHPSRGKQNSSGAGMAATAKDIRAAHVPDEVRSWWDTFNNGVTVEEQYDEEEPEVDPDSDFEQAAEEEQNAGVAASESDGKMAAVAHARVEEQSGGGNGARHRDGNYFCSYLPRTTISCFDSRHGRSSRLPRTIPQNRMPILESFADGEIWGFSHPTGDLGFCPENR
jgi:hypothetical protein